MMIKQVVLILSISLLASVRADGCSGQAKIGSQADLDALSSCRSYSGTISVDTSTAQTLQLNGLQTLNGDLVLKNNDNLSGFNAPALQSINGQLEIANQTRLSSFVIPKLQSAQGISMAILPQLANVSFLNTVSGLKKLSLTDTRAEKIQNPNVMALEQLTINNNNNLTSIQFPSLSKVDGDVYMTANGASCNVELPKLTSVKSATFRNMNNINIQSLNECSQDLSFNQNNMQQMSADALTSVGGSLILVDNNELGKISMQKLSLVGGAFSIGNNTHLLTIDGFPALQEVKGSIELSGAFDKVDIPVLQDVRGGMRLQTTSRSFQCSEVDKLRTSVIKGASFACQSGQSPDQLSSIGGQGDGKQTKSYDAAKGSGASNLPRLTESHSSLFAFAMCLCFVLVF